MELDFNHMRKKTLTRINLACAVSLYLIYVIPYHLLYSMTMSTMTEINIWVLWSIFCFISCRFYNHKVITRELGNRAAFIFDAFLLINVIITSVLIDYI